MNFLAQPGGVMDFSSSLEVAAKVVRDIVAETGHDLRIVRDDRGRLKFYFNCAAQDVPFDTYERLRSLCASLAPYAEVDISVKTVADVPDPEAFFTHGWCEYLVQDHSGAGAFNVPLKDQAAWGRDWLWKSGGETKRSAKKVTFHGLKGGVGRSTALVVLALEQAKRGRKVLVIDLDIESPGASAAMLAPHALPAYGIVDWMAEHLAGSDAVSISDCFAESALSASESGSIYVVPAAGSQTQDFISKLGRAYVEHNAVRFSDRVEQMLVQLETQIKPDLILIDSRAGLHEVSAFAISRVSDLSLLFFADTEQNWIGYRHLFEFWRGRREVLERVRPKLMAVRALAAEGADFQEFLEKSHALFSETLYDEIPPGGDEGDLFAFDLKDAAAPHYPPIIFMHSRLHEKNLLRPVEEGGASWEDVMLAFGRFVSRVSELLEE